jgi:hypothetical protein
MPFLLLAPCLTTAASPALPRLPGAQSTPSDTQVSTLPTKVHVPLGSSLTYRELKVHTISPGTRTHCYINFPRSFFPYCPSPLLFLFLPPPIPSPLIVSISLLIIFIQEISHRNKFRSSLFGRASTHWSTPNLTRDHTHAFHNQSCNCNCNPPHVHLVNQPQCPQTDPRTAPTATPPANVAAPSPRLLSRTSSSVALPLAPAALLSPANPTVA